jgi:hypothetical protein
MDPFLGLIAGLLVKGLIAATAGDLAAEGSGTVVDDVTPADVVEEHEVIPPVQ